MNLGAKHKQSLLLAAAVALACGLFAALNFLSAGLHLRADFTAGRVYSVSPATKRLLSRLQDPLSVTLYYSRELPPQILTMKSYARDFLNEYAAASGGKLSVSVRELGPENSEQGLKAGMLPVRFDIYAKDKYEQREGFFGLSVQYRDKKQLMPFINDVDGLEYELSSRIKAVLSDRKQAIGFVNGHGALTPYAMDPAFTAKIRSSYDIMLVDLAALSVSSDTVANMPAIFVLGPQGPLSEAEILSLDKYLAGGGSLVLALDAKNVSMRNYSLADNPSGLAAWLAFHGFKLSDGMVLDAQSQTIQVARQQGLFMFRNIVQYPPFVLAGDLDREHPVTRTLDSLVFPFTSAVSIVPGAAFKKLDVLVRSSKKSWIAPFKTGLPDVDPFRTFSPEQGAPGGPFGLALAAQACFKPYEVRGSSSAAVNSGTPLAQGCGRLALIGTSRFVQPELSMPDMNFIFLLNLMDWAAQEQDLVDIRAKASSFHPLRELSPGGKKFVRYMIVLLPPLLAALAGLGVWRLRLRRNRKTAAFYSSRDA